MLLGGYSELFAPFYGEDVDLSLRAWRMKWLCYYDPDATCAHKTSSTIKEHHRKKQIKLISTRNKLIFHEYHLAGFLLFKWRIKVALGILFRWVFDPKFYAAYRAYTHMKPAVHKAKLQFLQLQRDHAVTLTTDQAIKKIKAAIKQFSIVRI